MTRLIVTTVIPFLVVFLVYGHELLGVFGPTYTRGYVPLVIYHWRSCARMGGVFVGSAVGATGWLLMMTDHQYARMALDWLLAAVNIVLTYVFIRQFGTAGAALGTSLAIAVQNGIQVVLLRRFEGLWPFDRTFLPPIIAGLAALATMWTVQITVPGGVGIVSGSTSGVGVYVIGLRTLGGNPRDQLVVRELTDAYRAKLGG